MKSLFVAFLVLFVPVILSQECLDGSEAVQCFVDPCLINNCSRSCFSDYCGGCNARCVCQDDSDCTPGSSWCRVSEYAFRGMSGKPAKLCVPYMGEGDSCGGYVAAAHENRCAPGLLCAVPQQLPDMPGQCQKVCNSEESICSAQQYCSSLNVCMKHSTCATASDCVDPNNIWPHVKCFGYAVCDFGRCDWQCSHSQ